MSRRRHNSESFYSRCQEMCEVCSKLVGNVFLQITSCARIPEDYSAELAAHHASLRGLSNENRDSMGLLAAIFTGRESKARELLSLPWTNINAQYANGNTPLILAVQGENERLVKLLLEHPDINVNMRGMDGYTALIRACATEKADMVMLLLARPGINVNLSTYYGSTALSYAIRLGNEEAVFCLLMRRDIDVNFQSRHGENALIEAITYRRHDIARTLVNRADTELDIVDSRDRTPLILSVQYGYNSLVRLLLLYNCDPLAEDDCGRNALYYALRRGGAHDMVHYLVDIASQPQSLMRLCRSVIRRTFRQKYGCNVRLKSYIDRIPKSEFPRTLKRYVAFEP